MPITRLWRRLDTTGLEHALVAPGSDGVEIRGVALVLHGTTACELRYAIRLDPGWRTRAVAVEALVGGAQATVFLDADGAGNWKVDGAPAPALAGALDVDLGFSPLTNTLPIRRLALPPGAAAEVAAAWVRFPRLEVERLDQTYAHLGRGRWRYGSPGFETTLRVDRAGLVVEYPDLWEVVPPPRVE